MESLRWKEDEIGLVVVYKRLCDVWEIFFRFTIQDVFRLRSLVLEARTSSTRGNVSWDLVNMNFDYYFCLFSTCRQQPQTSARSMTFERFSWWRFQIISRKVLGKCKIEACMTRICWCCRILKHRRQQKSQTKSHFGPQLIDSAP